MHLATRQQVLRLYAQLKKPVSRVVQTATNSTAKSSGDTYINDLESHFFSTQYRLQHSSTPLHALPTPSITTLAAALSNHHTAPPLSSNLHRRHLLGVDVGWKQVGLALSDETFTYATPLMTLLRRSESQSSLAAMAARVRQLCDEYAVAGVVVGMPLSADGQLTAQCEEMGEFAEELFDAAFPAPHPPQPPSLLYWDERYSTASSRHRLAELGLDVERMKATGVMDSAAACRILDAFMDYMNQDGGGGARQTER